MGRTGLRFVNMAGHPVGVTLIDASALEVREPHTYT